MIKHPFEFKRDGLNIGFNWEDSVIPCKKVKISFSDKEIILDRQEFDTLMAIYADDKQMEDLLPATSTDFVSIERMLKLKAVNDIKAGEYITFPYVYWIPKTDYEELKKNGEMVRMVESKQKELIDYVSDNEAAKAIKEMWKTGKLTLDSLRE